MAALGLVRPEAELIQLTTYFQLLLAKSRVLNLISLKQDLKTQVYVHLVDSLSLLLWPKLPDAAVALDFGSGGGLPGFPLAICRPQWNLTLIDSKAKKIKFLDELKDQLKLNNVISRSVYLEPNKNPENVNYDFITARAVSALDTLIAIAGPRLAKNGFFAAYKGPQADDELSAAAPQLKKWGLKPVDKISFTLPWVNAARVIIIFQKS